MPEPTKNLWADTLPQDFEGAAFPVSKSFDVAIIGGGYTGLSAALHIAQDGKSVCVFEAETVGHGGSGRNAGFVNSGLWTPPDEVEKIIGPDVGKRLNTELATGPELVFNLIEKHQIQCSAVRKATLHYADTSSGLKELESRYNQQIARGAPVRLLDRQETIERTGSDKVLGSLWDPRAGTIQPLAYATGLAEAAKNAGAVIVERMTVHSLHRPRDVWILKTDAGEISANKVIQATNAYGTQGIPENEFIPVCYFKLATEPLSKADRAKILPQGEGCWDCAAVMSSFRLNEEGRLLIGGVGNLDGMWGAIHRAWARRQLTSLFPHLSHLKFEYAWCGRIAHTSDHLPKVVSIGENAISIYGYSGRGISPGTIFGRCAADWAVNDNADAFPIPISQKRRERFKGLKSLYYETGAAMTHLVRHRFG